MDILNTEYRIYSHISQHILAEFDAKALEVSLNAGHATQPYFK